MKHVDHEVELINAKLSMGSIIEEQYNPMNKQYYQGNISAIGHQSKPPSRTKYLNQTT